jgi:hypothetical protein
MHRAARLALVWAQLVVAVIAGTAASPLLAQKPQAVCARNQIISAFYYSATGILLHVEKQPDVTGRTIVALGSFQPPPVTENTELEPFVGAVIGAGANRWNVMSHMAAYAIYYGLEEGTVDTPGADEGLSSIPCGYEDVRRKFRPINEPAPGSVPPESCTFPRVCHCARTGSCCCW